MDGEGGENASYSESAFLYGASPCRGCERLGIRCCSILICFTCQLTLLMPDGSKQRDVLVSQIEWDFQRDVKSHGGL